MLKFVSDFISYSVFIKAFKFFIEIKRQKKQKEALSLSPFNKFIIVSICFMLFMRILGTLFGSLIGISSFFKYYKDPDFTNFRIIMGDIVFPIRDFIEVLFFSYLFFIQSKKQSKLA